MAWEELGWFATDHSPVISPITILHYIKHLLQCSVQHCIALCGTALHCIWLHFTELHFTALNHTTLHCTSLHCTTLHCTALHCTALPGLQKDGNGGNVSQPIWDFGSHFWLAIWNSFRNKCPPAKISYQKWRMPAKKRGIATKQRLGEYSNIFIQCCTINGAISLKNLTKSKYFLLNFLVSPFHIVLKD